MELKRSVSMVLVLSVYLGPEKVVTLENVRFREYLFKESELMVVQAQKYYLFDPEKNLARCICKKPPFQNFRLMKRILFRRCMFLFNSLKFCDSTAETVFLLEKVRLIRVYGPGSWLV